MKKTHILKSFRDLPSVAAQVADAPSPAIAKSSAPPGDPSGEDFREMLRARASAPFIPVIPYHPWGLNE